MSGYKPGYSEEHSPMFNLGREDGIRDAEAIGHCPPTPPRGPQPPFPRQSAMYRRGYDLEIALAVPHTCTEKCKR